MLAQREGIVPENLGSALKDVVESNVPVDADLPDWAPDVLLMAIFGYDEEQMLKMSPAIKMRLMFMYSELQKASSGTHQPVSNPMNQQKQMMEMLGA